jgi:hypothetical protein
VIAKAQAIINVNTTQILVTYGETVAIPVATSNYGSVVCDKVSADMVNVGSYVITFTINGTANYEGDTEAVNVTVNKKAITVTAVEKTIVEGSQDVPLTYTLSSNALVGSDQLTGSLSRSAGTNAGIYNILQGNLTAGDNYDITFVGATYTIRALTLVVTVTDNGNQTEVQAEIHSASGFDPSYTIVVEDYYETASVWSNANNYKLEQAVMIQYLDSDGNQESLDSAITITLPLNGANLNVDKISLARLDEDGTLTDIEFIVEGNNIIFTTDMVGNYVVLDADEEGILSKIQPILIGAAGLVLFNLIILFGSKIRLRFRKK